MFTLLFIRDPARRIRGSVDMKSINKRPLIIGNNSGETIAEVVVAFALLSIMLVILFQGMQNATKNLANANDHRKSSDIAMIQLQSESLTNGSAKKVVEGTNIYRYVVRIPSNGQNYVYVVYSSSPASSPASSPET